MPKETRAINAKLIEYVPELASPYVKYPMAHPRWLETSEKAPGGEMCYIVSADEGPRPDYVYGPGPCGVGYYHLLTQHAHVILYNRLRNQSPIPMCSCNSVAYDKMDEFDDVKRIIWARAEAKQPNDARASGDAMKTLADTVNVWRSNQSLESYDGVSVDGGNADNRVTVPGPKVK